MKTLGMIGILALGYGAGSPAVAPSMPPRMAAALSGFHNDIDRTYRDLPEIRAKLVAATARFTANTQIAYQQARSPSEMSRTSKESVDSIQIRAASAIVTLGLGR